MMVFTHNEEETTALAGRVAGRIQKGDVLLLSGDLGTGKTVFARGIIRSLSGDPALTVPSPTYTLVQSYNTPRGIVWHFDLYRIEGPEEICEIGWDAARENGGIALVEWPEKMGLFVPANALRLSFGTKDGHRFVDGPESLLS
ncbi:MAG: tRNA (adenosine(37)-N6)-threonylcarbamoyltransferase complex ATPase subunit type 1 TsaE [Rhodospirillales bacterium]|nr:tRNA (adenosine(37)-N6)-threonylcarbamoyltransferase complex ATPase subunit type 1 TsaE [Rhodospirillales bacterium]